MKTMSETGNLMTQSQETTVAALTVLGGSLSLLGSITIIYNIISKQKFKQGSYHRLLLGTCAFDIISSLGWLMQTFAAPKETSDRYLSIGNVASCTASGFLLQCAMGFMVYNACLTIYFLATIRYNINEVRLLRMEKIMHVISIVWGLGSATIPLPLQLYNENVIGPGCWISDFPLGCSADSDVECSRGMVAPQLIGYAIALFPACFSIITVFVSNLLVYRTVRTKALATQKVATQKVATQKVAHRFSKAFRKEQKQTELTKKIASQASWYVTVYANSLFWQGALRALNVANVITRENESQWTFLIALSQFFSSSAGFGFLLVFVRPRYLRFREQDAPRLTAFIAALSFDDKALQSPRIAPNPRLTSSWGGILGDSSWDPRGKSLVSSIPSNAYLDDSANPRHASDDFDTSDDRLREKWLSADELTEPIFDFDGMVP